MNILSDGGCCLMWMNWSRAFLISAATLISCDLLLRLFDLEVQISVLMILLLAGAALLDLFNNWVRTIGFAILALTGFAGAFFLINFLFPVLGRMVPFIGDPSALQLNPVDATMVVFLASALIANRLRSGLPKDVPTSYYLVVPALLACLLAALAGIFNISDQSDIGPYVNSGWLNIFTAAALSGHILFEPPLQRPMSVFASTYATVSLSRYFTLLSAIILLGFGYIFLRAFELGYMELRSAVVGFLFISVSLIGAMMARGACWAHNLNVARDLAVRRLEEAWKGRESYFRSLIEDSPIIIYLTDKNVYSTFLNRHWAEYTGQSIPQALGLGWIDCVHPMDRERVRKNTTESILRRIEPFSGEYRLRRADGQYRWVIATGIPRFDDKNRFIGYMGHIIDVHDHKVKQDLLIKDKKNAELSSQIKSQFLANMSHEIRTPLNAILGFADLCTDVSCGDSERQEYLKRIRYNGDHLLRLIDDILDLSKLESGSAVVQKTQFSIARVMEEAISSLRALASRKGLYLKLNVEPSIPPVVYSDPHRIKQIVNNLVGNAIKFTSVGGVRVTVSSCSSHVFIEITDTGIGLTSEQRANLFKPFSQGDGSVTRKFGGTGLGLHLSKKVAQSIGGDVELKSSEIGVGSTFIFTIDAGNIQERAPVMTQLMSRASVPRAAARPRSEARFLGKKILLAEDSVDSKELIDIYFRSTGAQLIFAENGEEAVALALRENPDLILMDVQMPEMDGLEATRQLRSRGFDRPIVALTAHALQDEVDRSFEAGCNFHLTKPVMKDILLSLVADLLSHKPAMHV